MLCAATADEAAPSSLLLLGLELQTAFVFCRIVTSIALRSFVPSWYFWIVPCGSFNLATKVKAPQTGGWIVSPFIFAFHTDLKGSPVQSQRVCFQLFAICFLDAICFSFIYD